MDEQRRQEYLKLIDQFLNCTSEQELNEVFSAHRALIDPDFWQVMAQVAKELEAQGNVSVAREVAGLMIALAEAIGIQMISPQTAKASAQFLWEILQCIDTHQGAKEPVYKLLRDNQARLNADLLAVLPGVAANLLASTQGKEQVYRAAVLVEFGNLLEQFPLGQRPIKMELAIAAYEQVLQVTTREAMPVKWVTTQMILASAYAERIRGDRADNLEQAIVAYEQALQMATREAMPVEWAIAQINLALAYLHRIRGNRADNLEQSIAANEQVLQVITRETMPIEWATAQMNLAIAYYSRIRGDRAETLERAIVAYEQALQVITRETMPVEWAKVQINLALAYLHRIRGNRVDNLEQVIVAYEQVLQVITSYAHFWCMEGKEGRAYSAG